MSALRRFRLVSLAEGVSYLVLLGIAMPLKYGADMPIAVRMTGMVHGVLFIAFAITLAAAARAGCWSKRQSAVALIAALLPFGAFWLERRLREGTAPVA